MFDIIIKNGTIVDGSGKNSYRADLGIKDDKIIKIGDLSQEGAKTTIDAQNKMVVPGFIDPHTHTDLSILFEPSMTNFLQQGVTTVVGGNCGHSYGPVGDELYRAAIVDTKVAFKADPSYFEMTKLLMPKEKAVQALKSEYGIDMDWHSFGEYLDKCNEQPMDGNIVPLVGYSAIRGTVMGLDCCREASEEEIVQMEALTRQCMEEGAYGLSTGTDPQYVPGPFATFDETVRMLKIVKEYDGIFSSHTRNYDALGHCDRMGGYKDMLEQALQAQVRCNVSHVHTLGMGVDEASNAKAAQDTLAYFEEMAAKGVDLSFDVIPSPYSMDMTVPYFATFLRPFVLMSGSRQHLAENFKVPDFRKMIHRVVEDGLYPLLDSKNIMTSMYPILNVSIHSNPEYVGKNLYAYALEKQVDPLDLVMDMFSEDCDMRADMMLPDAVESNRIICQHEMAMMCSDGFSGDINMNFGLNDDLQMTPNPMNFSFAIRYLTQYAPTRFEDAIHVLTGKVADRFRIEKRGILAEGNYADIVVLDKERLHSYDRDPNPSQYPEGIDYVLVNGQITIDHKKHTNARNGRMLKKNRDN
ncbi:MAG: amidohydrolase family protein [Traorella sp.]